MDTVVKAMTSLDSNNWFLLQKNKEKNPLQFKIDNTFSEPI